MSSWSDILMSVRTLTKNRAFTIAAILTVAIGIGSTTAIATIVDCILLRPLAYPESIGSSKSSAIVRKGLLFDRRAWLGRSLLA